MSQATRVFNGQLYHLVKSVGRGSAYNALMDASVRSRYSAPYRTRGIAYKWVRTRSAWLLYVRRTL